MADFSVRIKGHNKLIQKLKKLIPRSDDMAKKAMHEIVFAVEKDAKIICPVDEGNLRASIHSVVSRRANRVEGRVYASTEYAIFVHEGTSKMAARPFLKNAMDKNVNKIEEHFKVASYGMVT